MERLNNITDPEKKEAVLKVLSHFGRDSKAIDMVLILHGDGREYPGVFFNRPIEFFRDLDEIGSKLEDDNVTVEEVWLMKKFESKLAKYSLEGSYYRLGSALFYGTGRKDYFVWLNEDEGDIRVKQRFLPLELRLALEHLVLALVCLYILPINYYKYPAMVLQLTVILQVPLFLINLISRLHYKMREYIVRYIIGVVLLIILVDLLILWLTPH